jgi:hypothetical protein
MPIATECKPDRPFYSVNATQIKSSEESNAESRRTSFCGHVSCEPISVSIKKRKQSNNQETGISK